MINNNLNITCNNDYQTNLAIKNCSLPKDCEKQNNVFQVEKLPRKNEGMYVLNQKLYDNRYDYNCKRDPRLFDQVRGEILQLDRPPIDSTANIKSIFTDENLSNNRTVYRNYKDITRGDVEYYVNNKQKDAFFNPVFSNETNVYGYLYKDPMDAIKPAYFRQVRECSNDTDKFDGCLSFIHDSNEQRADLISKQMNIRNRQKYESRWY
jgi:hypothetical protein